MINNFICIGLLTVTFNLNAQTSNIDTLSKKVETIHKDVEVLKRLKVTGWVQAQYQWAESRGAKNFDGGDFDANSFNRFMIRRGRVKFTYSNHLSQFVLQLNATERGVNLVEIFGTVKDPWTKSFGITAGVMNRPFGYEIAQSSAVRETPERSRFTQNLLPNERDLGAMLFYEPVKGSKLFGLKVMAGFYNGTGIAVPGTTSLNQSGIKDFDSFKDFIARVQYARKTKNEKIEYGFGASHYNGGYVYVNNKVYQDLTSDALGMNKWVISDTTNQTFKGGKAPRIYSGADFQFSYTSKIGKTTLRSEYILGTQSGTKSSTKSATALPTSDTYTRNFDGFYTYLIHRIGKTKHEIALKYEWYDPNTKVSTADFKTGTSLTEGEIKYTMLGVGYNYYWDENVKFMFYYNMVQNEKGDGLTGYTKDIKDNILTIRMQYRF